ncbi:MAG: 3-oxoacyl-ACP reductase [Blastocatellia bacterium]|nr:MAG: 3-oxoacyl-ACP reductase [Blastocatellia bacterium]
MKLGLEGKIAMVGGASKGLGFAVARELAAEGAHVSIASRSAAAIEAAAEALRNETGGQVLASVADVTSADAIDRWHAATLARFGGVDLLFANGGGPSAGSVLDFDDSAWRSAFDLLVLAVVRQVRLVVPSMQQRGGGAILMSTSSAVKEPIANIALSNVLRASVSALAKTLALELASSGIRVNQIIPGRIGTDRVTEIDAINARKAGISPGQQKERSVAAIPLGRYGEPGEFGRVAAFLLSQAAAYLTGASVQVDGGLVRGVL